MAFFWEKNLVALKEYQQPLYDLVCSHHFQPIGEVIATPAGISSLRFFSQDGSGVLAYNAVDPWLDTATHLQTVEVDSRGLAMFIGMGLGYGPLRVLQERQTLGMMVIVEPCLDLLCTALKHVDLVPLFTSRKVHWLVGDVDLSVLECMVARIASLEDTHILRHVPSFQWRETLYTPLGHQAFLIVNQLNASGGTTRKAGASFFHNRLGILSLLRHSTDLSATKNILANKPAVLVAAGPSLDRSMAELKKVADHCVLFAVDSALAPLLKAGITPDFVTTIDFMDLNFEKVAPFVGGDWSFSLVATSKVTPLILKRLKARHLFLAFNEDVPQQWIHDALGIKELTPFSFSVAHLSLGVALRMGCNPITFIGQDLGYTTGAGDHAAGTIIMKNGLPTDREIFQVPGVEGGLVATDRGLLSLQKRFEDIIADNPGTTYFNATLAGAHIHGTTPRPLLDIAKEYMPGVLSVGGIVDQAMARQQAYPVADFVRKCEAVLKSIKSNERHLQDVLVLANDVKRGLSRLRKKGLAVHSFEALPAALAKKMVQFDRCNKAVDDNHALSEHVMELTYPALSENDRLLEQNNSVREKEGYLAWLLGEVGRIDTVNRERLRAFTLYKNLLQNLSQHLTLEGQGSDRLSIAPSTKEYLAMARLYAGNGDYQLARECIEQSLVQEAESADSLILAGEIWAALFQFEKANAAWQKAIGLDKKREGEIKLLRLKQAEFWIAIADEHANAGEPGDNFPQLLPVWLERVADILSHEADVPDTLQRLWWKHRAKMEEWLAIGETQHLELTLNGWMAFGVRFPEVLVFQSRYDAFIGNTEAAITALQQAVRQKPDQSQWFMLLARLLLEAGRFDEGILSLQEAVALDARAAVLWEELGDSLLSTDMASAALAYERCYLALPERIDALRKIGDCYFQSNQLGAAIAAYEAVLVKNPGNEAAAIGLARARALAQ